MAENFEKYNYLGFNSPYYFVDEGKFVIEKSFASITKRYHKPKVIDPVAIIELLNNNYYFGDRTIIHGIKKTPWLAKPDLKNDAWLFDEFLNKTQPIDNEEQVADEMFNILLKEIVAYCDGKKNIGLLLSGGMDSRVIAGLLYYVKKNKILDINIIAATWGLENSRDVEYARSISRELGFEWVHFPLSPEDLIRNVDLTAQRGCEYSPIHLHAMPRIRDMEGVDCFLGGILGDSIGRGAYSGRHLLNLRPLEHGIINYGYFVKHSVYASYKSEIANDIGVYENRYSHLSPEKRREVLYQAIYLRRMLYPAMDIINEKIPVYQLFASPEMYNYIFSLSPKVRNNSVYVELFKKLHTYLTNVPWAKSGRKYMDSTSLKDNLAPSYHNYYKWIRLDLHDYLNNAFSSPGLHKLNVFNEKALASTLKLISTSKVYENPKLTQTLLWIASVSKLAEDFNLKGIKAQKSQYDFMKGYLLGPISLSLQILKKKAGYVYKKFN